MDEKQPKDGNFNLKVGDIINSQGIGLGKDVDVEVTGNNMPGSVEINKEELRSGLTDLYHALAKADLPQEKIISAQTSTGKALEAITEKEVKSKSVVENVKKVGETIKEANVVVKEGTSLWESVLNVSKLIGPLVGGARVVAAWFGVPM